MARYKYKGTNSEGKKVQGFMNATNEKELYQKLRDTDIYMTDAKEAAGNKKGTKIKDKQLSEFCRSVGTLLGSGVSLVRALAIVSQEETTKPAYRTVYADLLKCVRQGSQLSDAMSEQGDAFPDMLIYMIRSAEASGSLDKVFLRMADHFEKDFRTKSKIRSAMTYPIILLIMTVAVVLIVFTFVIPQFQELFSQMDDLPVVTKIVMGISDSLKSRWYVYLFAVVVIYAAVTVLFHIPVIKKGWDKLLVKLPGIGKLTRIIYTARFSRTLCSLYSAGLPMVTALQISKNTIGNTYIESQFAEVVSKIRSGANLSDAIYAVDGFTHKLASTIMIGEETGSLDSMLESTADMLDYEADMAIQKLTTMLEPIMIVIMAFIVGMVIISVIVPIYGSYEAIEKSS